MNYLASAALHSGPPEAAAMANEYLSGDIVAGEALSDWHKENETVNDHPFKVGDKVFLFGVTLYHLGEVAEIGRGWVRLKDCHWVHWTGRLSSLFKTCDLTETHGSRKPRAEYLGEFVVYLQTVVGVRQWTGNIPKASVE